MDYWEQVELHKHINFEDFSTSLHGGRLWMMTTHAEQTLWDAHFNPGDTLLFGPESRGLPADLLGASPDNCLRIPMRRSARSLNLATAVGVTLYEALRQLQLEQF